MRTQIIQDEDIAWAQCWSQNVFDVGVKHFAIHGAIEDQAFRCPIKAHRRENGYRLPMTVWGGVITPRAPIGATI